MTRSAAPGARRARRGRPSRTQPDALVPRERILNAAAHLFRERGYQRTTVRDIADAVGLLSGSLFYHVHSKEEMLAQIMREAALASCVRAEEAIAGPAPAAEKLRRLIRMELSCLSSENLRDYHSVLFFEWREIPEPARIELMSLRSRYSRLWRGVFEACRNEGQLRCEPDAARLALRGAINGALIWFEASGRYSLDEYADILANLVLV